MPRVRHEDPQPNTSRLTSYFARPAGCTGVLVRCSGLAWHGFHPLDALVAYNEPPIQPSHHHRCRPECPHGNLCDQYRTPPSRHSAFAAAREHLDTPSPNNPSPYTPPPLLHHPTTHDATAGRPSSIERTVFEPARPVCGGSRLDLSGQCSPTSDPSRLQQHRC